MRVYMYVCVCVCVCVKYWSKKAKIEQSKPKILYTYDTLFGGPIVFRHDRNQTDHTRDGSYSDVKDFHVNRI